jgi:dipeptidyl-peptidase-3
LFWINSGPFNLTPGSCAEAGRRRAGAGRHAGGRGGCILPHGSGESPADLARRLAPVLLDPAVDAMVTNKTPGAGGDILRDSANNLYDGVSTADLEGFVERYPLNSRLVKRDGRLVEEVYRVGGRYDAELRRIIGHIEAALPLPRRASRRPSPRSSSGIAPAKTAIARPSTSPGCGPPTRPWTR